jgi:hypothetical protein
MGKYNIHSVYYLTIHCLLCSNVRHASGGLAEKGFLKKTKRDFSLFAKVINQLC